MLTRARETALAAYAHQDLPFDRVVDSVSPVRSLSRNPLFQVIVHVRDHLRPPVSSRRRTAATAGHGVHVAGPVFDMAHADLSVNFFGTEGSGHRGNLIFRTELYRRNTIERLAGWLTRVVTEFANDIDQSLRDVVLTDAQEQRRILTRGAEAHRRLTSASSRTAGTRPVGVVGDDDVRGVPCGFDIARLAAAGDLARWTEDGRLEVSRTPHRGRTSSNAGRAAQRSAPPSDRTDTEHALAAVFADLLSTSEVGRFDDFFALGGDSILSVQLASRARAGTGGQPADGVREPDAKTGRRGGCARGDRPPPERPETRFEPMTTSGLSATDLAAVTQLWSKSRDGTS